MEKKCEVKQFQKVVNNESLEVYGQLKFQFIVSDTAINLTLSTNANGSHLLIKNGNTTVFDDDLVKRSYTLQGAANTVYDITFDNKYNISQINGYNGCKLDLKQLCYPGSLAKLIVGYTDYTIGTIEDLYKCIALVDLNVSSTPNVVGDLATLAVKMLNFGRTSGTMHFQGTGTANVVGIAGSRNCYLTFGNGTISVSSDAAGQTVIATYANGQWSYPNP
jgi:hypothetical protein